MGPNYGEWIVQENISDENRKIFDTALARLVNHKYEPIAVAIQIVNGINYQFIAKSIPLGFETKTGIVKIYVLVSTPGSEPLLFNIEKII